MWSWCDGFSEGGEGFRFGYWDEAYHRGDACGGSMQLGENVTAGVGEGPLWI